MHESMIEWHCFLIKAAADCEAAKFKGSAFNRHNKRYQSADNVLSRQRFKMRTEMVRGSHTLIAEVNERKSLQ